MSKEFNIQIIGQQERYPNGVRILNLDPETGFQLDEFGRFLHTIVTDRNGSERIFYQDQYDRYVDPDGLLVDEDWEYLTDDRGNGFHWLDLPPHDISPESVPKPWVAKAVYGLMIVLAALEFIPDPIPELDENLLTLFQLATAYFGITLPLQKHEEVYRRSKKVFAAVNDRRGKK